MVVNSVLSAGVAGVKNGLSTAQSAAQDIANLNTSTPDEPTVDRLGASNQDNAGTNGLDNLTQAIVDLKVGEQQVKASTAVIRTADEVLGTLIDTTA